MKARFVALSPMSGSSALQPDGANWLEDWRKITDHPGPWRLSNASDSRPFPTVPSLSRHSSPNAPAIFSWGNTDALAEDRRQMSLA